MSEQVKVREHIKVAPTENVIIWMMYYVAIPIARVALALKISPNSLTTLSSGFAVCSGVALIVDGQRESFMPLFLISLILDFADGLVARTSGIIGRKAFRYDHISDLFKISFVVLCLLIFCNSTLVWMLGMSSIMLFLISTVLSHDLSFVRKSSTQKSGQDSCHVSEPKNAVITNIFTIFLTYNSHTLLMYVFIAANPQFAAHVFAYLIVVSAYACVRYINALSKLDH